MMEHKVVKREICRDSGDRQGDEGEDAPYSSSLICGCLGTNSWSCPSPLLARNHKDRDGPDQGLAIQALS